ncbi:MAG: hypothetical protein ACYCYO_01680 [Bacilli bacterium]
MNADQKMALLNSLPVGEVDSEYILVKRDEQTRAVLSQLVSDVDGYLNDMGDEDTVDILPLAAECGMVVWTEEKGFQAVHHDEKADPVTISRTEWERLLHVEQAYAKERTHALETTLRMSPNDVWFGGEIRDPAVFWSFVKSLAGKEDECSDEDNITKKGAKRMSESKPSTPEDAIQVLHLHAQRIWHDEAYIVANRVALEKLKSCIEEALQKGQTCGLFYPTDGEGFHLHILMYDSDWQSESWQRRALPYSDETAFATSNTGRDVRYPWNEIVDWVCAEDTED